MSSRHNTWKETDDASTDVFELELTTYYTPEKATALSKKQLSDLYVSLRDQYAELGLDTFPRERDYLHIRPVEPRGFMIAWYANKTTRPYEQIHRLYASIRRNDPAVQSTMRRLCIDDVVLKEKPYVPDPEYLEYRARGEHKLQHSVAYIGDSRQTYGGPPGILPVKNPNKQYVYSGASYVSFKKNIGKKSNEETRELARRIEKAHTDLDAALRRRAEIEKQLAAMAPSGGPALHEWNLSLKIASLEETLAAEKASRQKMEACLADIQAEIESPSVVPQLLKAAESLREKR